MINWKMESLQQKSVTSLEKTQSIYTDELQIFRKELESKNQIINKLLEMIENISNKAIQPNPQPIPQLYFEDHSNNTNDSERERKSKHRKSIVQVMIRKNLNKKWII